MALEPSIKPKYNLKEKKNTSSHKEPDNTTANYK